MPKLFILFLSLFTFVVSARDANSFDVAKKKFTDASTIKIEDVTADVKTEKAICYTRDANSAAVGYSITGNNYLHLGPATDEILNMKFVGIRFMFMDLRLTNTSEGLVGKNTTIEGSQYIAGLRKTDKHWALLFRITRKDGSETEFLCFHPLK